MISRKLETTFCENPRRLFLIDGVGALLSAFMLGVVLVKLDRIFGIPESTLYVLASFPIAFAIYDWYNYRKDSDKLTGFLRGIAILNLLYCALSIGLGMYHQRDITRWGWMYIIAEVLVILILAVVELRVAKKLVNIQSKIKY